MNEPAATFTVTLTPEQMEQARHHWKITYQYIDATPFIETADGHYHYRGITLLTNKGHLDTAKRLIDASLDRPATNDQATAAHEEVLAQYDGVFRQLAEYDQTDERG